MTSRCANLLLREVHLAFEDLRDAADRSVLVPRRTSHPNVDSCVVGDPCRSDCAGLFAGSVVSTQTWKTFAVACVAAVRHLRNWGMDVGSLTGPKLRPAQGAVRGCGKRHDESFTRLFSVLANRCRILR